MSFDNAPLVLLNFFIVLPLLTQATFGLNSNALEQ